MMHMKVDQHPLLPTLSRIWRYLLAEPGTWLFLCFFQPARFESEYGQRFFLQRMALLLRSVLLLFLLSYPFAVAMQVLLPNCLLSCTSFKASFAGMNLLLPVAQASALGIACGMVAGLLGDVGVGIVLGIALGMTGVVVGHVEGGFARGLVIAAALGLVAGTGRGQQWGIRGGVAG